MKHIVAASLLVATLFTTLPAVAFELTFDWGNIPRCDTGSPNVVKNPIFGLSNVPQGTAQIRFRLVDQDVPDYDHGGGRVAYSGQTVIEPGAFTYKSPCPPGGSHSYQWTATALDAGGKSLATARARKSYP